MPFPCFHISQKRINPMHTDLPTSHLVWTTLRWKKVYKLLLLLYNIFICFYYRPTLKSVTICKRALTKMAACSHHKSQCLTNFCDVVFIYFSLDSLKQASHTLPAEMQRTPKIWNSIYCYLCSNKYTK